MRQLTAHRIGGVNEQLVIDVLDEPGHGGACHRYLITGYGEPAGMEGQGIATGSELASICFQNGPIGEAGVNGVTHESLLAILIDRLQGFQSGQYACRENAIALTKLQEALMWLQSRTRERLARGVEGTSAK